MASVFTKIKDNGCILKDYHSYSASTNQNLCKFRDTSCLMNKCKSSDGVYDNMNLGKPHCTIDATGNGVDAGWVLKDLTCKHGKFDKYISLGAWLIIILFIIIIVLVIFGFVKIRKMATR